MCTWTIARSRMPRTQMHAMLAIPMVHSIKNVDVRRHSAHNVLLCVYFVRSASVDRSCEWASATCLQATNLWPVNQSIDTDRQNHNRNTSFSYMRLIVAFCTRAEKKNRICAQDLAERKKDRFPIHKYVSSSISAAATAAFKYRSQLSAEIYHLARCSQSFILFHSCTHIIREKDKSDDKRWLHYRP